MWKAQDPPHLSLMKTLLGQVKLSLTCGELRQLLPLLFRAGLLGKAEGGVQVTELDGKVEPGGEGVVGAV